MSRVCGICNTDHEADRLRGAAREMHGRAERWGPAFETITGNGILADVIELRATQTEDGAWEASVYAARYEAIADCEVGRMEFVGFAATQDRAELLALQFAATLVLRHKAEHDAFVARMAAHEAARS